VTWIEFGKHQGERITRVPASYLRWMVREGTPQSAEAAEELERRGTALPTVEVSGHALDRFSQRHLGVWLDAVEGGCGEGLWTFVNRLASGAVAVLTLGGKAPLSTLEATSKVEHAGVTWTFATEGNWPVVKTVT